MKKLQIFALAALVAIGFSSCIKEQGSEIKASKKQYALTIKMANENTRGVAAPYDPSVTQITIKSGRVFVFDETGAFVTSQALATGFVSGDGQTVTDPVPAGAQVYVVANGPTSLATFNGNLDALKATATDVSQTVVLNEVTLVNVNGEPEAIVATEDSSKAPLAGTAVAEVTIAPAIARLELTAVTAKDIDAKGVDGTLGTADDPTSAQIRATVAKVTATSTWSVTGVYLNNYYPQYTLGAGNSGSIISSTDVTALSVNDTAAVSFASGVAQNGSGQVWGYNVAAGTAASTSPKLHITMKNTGATPATNQNKTISISGYGSSFTGFKAGNIYRIASIDFAGKDWNALPEKPEEGENYALTVEVTVQNWQIVNLVADVE